MILGGMRGTSFTGIDDLLGSVYGSEKFPSASKEALSYLHSMSNKTMESPYFAGASSSKTRTTRSKSTGQEGS